MKGVAKKNERESSIILRLMTILIGFSSYCSVSCLSFPSLSVYKGGRQTVGPETVKKKNHTGITWSHAEMSVTWKRKTEDSSDLMESTQLYRILKMSPDTNNICDIHSPSQPKVIKGP